MLKDVEFSIFQQVPFENTGWFQRSLNRSGSKLSLQIPFHEITTISNISQQAGIILLGGPMSANDNLPFLKAQLKVLELALYRNIPILGICLGAQLLAKAAGAPIYKNQVSEVGFFDVTLTPEALQDDVMGGLNPVEKFFHWHCDTFDLPNNATRLASSKSTVNQAFRLGDCAYGLQFHPEVTPELIADWCVQDVNCSDMAEIETPIDPFTNAARLEHVAGLIFDSWIQLALSKQKQCD